MPEIRFHSLPVPVRQSRPEIALKTQPRASFAAPVPASAQSLLMEGCDSRPHGRLPPKRLGPSARSVAGRIRSLRE